MGNLVLYLNDFVNMMIRAPDAPPLVPIGRWFHIEFRLRRASDATGLVALYQDGALLYEAGGIKTDETLYGQWYVGNWVDSLMPAPSTIYVDDVTIRAAP